MAMHDNVTGLVDADVMQIAMQLPRARRLQQRVVDALAHGKTVMWALPPGRNASGLVTIVRNELRSRGFGTQVLDVTDRDAPPLTTLLEIVRSETLDDVDEDDGSAGRLDGRGGIKAKGCKDPGSVKGRGHQSTRIPDPYEEMQDRSLSVMVLRGVETHRYRWFDHWAELIERWADTSRIRSTRDVNPVGLLVPVTDARLMDKIDPDVFLLKEWYAGDIGEAEMRFLVGEMLENRPPMSDADRRWIEASYVSLSGSDPALFAWLVRHCHEDNGKGEINDILVAYMQARGWQPLLEEMHDLSEGWAVGGMLRAMTEDGTSLENAASGAVASTQLWWHGIVMGDRVNGTYVHSSALAYRGKTHIVNHRMWRGHARTLLPIIDAVRLDMCRYLSASFPGWESALRPAAPLRALRFSPDDPSLDPSLASADHERDVVEVEGRLKTTGSSSMARVAGGGIFSPTSSGTNAEDLNTDEAFVWGEFDAADGMEVTRHGDVFLTEFPGLLEALKTHVQPQRGHEAVGPVYRSLQFLRVARNLLAHYSPLSRMQFDRVWHEIDCLYRWMV